MCSFRVASAVMYRYFVFDQLVNGVGSFVILLSFTERFLSVERTRKVVSERERYNFNECEGYTNKFGR